jgi:hypothetical protein
MAIYHLTESYGDLNNPRVTDFNYYDNLRFVDNLFPEQIEEVMESLIWEFMDYGDSFDEAVESLKQIFSEDGIELYEAIDLINEARIDPNTRRELRKRQAEADAALSRQKETNLKAAANKEADSRRRAMRATRAAAIRSSIGQASRTVKGALKGAREQVRNRRAQLAAKGSDIVLRGQAALSKIARTAKGAVKGAISGARSEYNKPSVGPSSRIPGRQQSQMARAAARVQAGDVFATPKRKAVNGKTIHGGPAPAPPGLPKKNKSLPDPWEGKSTQPIKKIAVKKDVTRSMKALPSSGQTGGSTKKSGKILTSSQRGMKNAALSRRLSEDIDYDVLTQYMIEDIISEGYATTEEDALDILENMEPETLNELVECYLED